MNPMSEEDRAWLHEAMSSGGLVVDEVAQIEELVGLLVRKNEELAGQPDGQDDDIDEAVDTLVDIVSQVDRATDIHRMGKFDPVVALLKSGNAQIRMAACEIIGTCLQNNPEMQQVALDRQVLQHATHLAVFDERADVRTKAMLAVSCQIRNCPAAEALFINDGDGLSLLCRGISPEPAARAPGSTAFPGEPSLSHRRKCLHLLLHLLKATPQHIDPCLPLDLLPSLASGMASEDDVDVAETSLSMLLYVVSTSPAAHAAAVDDDALRQQLQSRADEIAAMSAEDKEFFSSVAAAASHLLARLQQPPPPPIPEPAPATAPAPDTPVRFPISTPTPASAPAFVATWEWQELAPDQGVPPGLHVRLDMTTGKRFAKLNDPNDAGDANMKSIVVQEGDGPVTIDS